MRAILFVDQLHLQRSLARELGDLGFEVILPITLNEARRAMQPQTEVPDLIVMNLRNAEGGTLDLLDILSTPGPRAPVVLIAEAAEIATERHRVSLDGVVVLPTEIQNFSRSVRRLCGLERPV